MRISVIIPTLNEPENVLRAVNSALSAGVVEVIVADGGSKDGTPVIAEGLGAKVLDLGPGRAGQMNAGAAAASGDVLLFLHADTRLPKGYGADVREALGYPGAVAGAFKLSIDSPGLGPRVIERLANWRTRAMRMPYGDQAIFVKAEAFREAGGFPDMPIMEDFELMRRLRRLGRVVPAPACVVTSGRRWERLGVLRTTLINQLMIIGYLMGVPPKRLARWYGLSARA